MPKWILLYRMRIDLVMNYWMKPVADEETIHQHTTNRQGNIFLVLIPFNISNSISTTRQTNDRRCWKKMPSTTSINCRFVVCHSFSVGFFASPRFWRVQLLWTSMTSECVPPFQRTILHFSRWIENCGQGGKPRYPCAHIRLCGVFFLSLYFDASRKPAFHMQCEAFARTRHKKTIVEQQFSICTCSILFVEFHIKTIEKSLSRAWNCRWIGKS